MATLRPATANDAAAMARIQIAAMREGGTDDYTEAQLEALAPNDAGQDTVPAALFEKTDRRGVVAEDDGDIVGWGSLRLEEGVLAATFVAPERTGQGIGREIVESLEAAAREAGLDQLVVPASLNAVEFYRRLGYEEGEAFDASAPDDPSLPAIRMTKQL